MALRPIYEVFERESGYDGGGRRREQWWRQTAARKQLRAALEVILAAARVWQRESGRRGKGRGWEEVA